MSEAKEAPAPENADAWASWFQDHPNLRTSEPVSVSVGSATGIEIDVTPISGICVGEGVPCIPLYKGSDEGSALAVYKDWTDRLTILDVEGETVIIDISAKTKELKTFHQKAQQVLGTVKWNYSSSPSPDDVLESQYRHINAGHYRLAYDLFADQSQELISQEQYKAFFEAEAPYEITSYSFSPVRTPGDMACVDVDLAVSSASGEDELQVIQQLVPEDGSWRVVMREKQVEVFSDAGSPSAGASADGSPEDGTACESLP